MFSACTRAVARGGVAVLLGVSAVIAAGAEYREGTHYRQLPIAVETADAGKIEVVEVFSYACIHCYTLEPVLAAWQRTLADDVVLRRLPLVSPRLLPLAQAYFTAEALDVIKAIHLPLFEAIHEHGIDMTQPRYIRRLFEREAQVTEEDFQRTFESFGVRSRVRQADAQARSFRITATPTLVVNGRYIAETSAAGGMQNMLRVVDYLVEQERQAMAPASPPAVSAATTETTETTE